MKYYNGTPVGDGILPEKSKAQPSPYSEDCAIFMTYDQLVEKWRKRKRIK